MEKREQFAEGLSAILIKNKALSVQEALRLREDFAGRGKDTFDNFLLSEGLISKQALLNALSEYFEVPSVDLTDYELLDPILPRLFPKDLLLQYACIPVEVDEDELLVVASFPHDEEMVSDLATLVSYDIQLAVGLKQQIIDEIRDMYDGSATLEDPEDMDLRVERQQAREEMEEVEKDGEAEGDAEDLVNDKDKYFTLFRGE
jgi:hypothetical protein